jgi:peptidoglycan/LPS O-acetylase OafA/YrhL
LDGLRALAIGLVISCHYDAFASSFGGVTQFGWVGVDIFFVLSGFLITSILLQLQGNPLALLVFYARRTLRIFPPYFLILVLVLTASTALRPEKWHLTAGIFLVDATFADSLRNSREAMVHALSAVRLLSPPSLFLSAPLPITTPHRPEHLESTLTVLWSLSVEEWFYIFWAPIVLKFKRRRVVPVIAAAIVVSFFFRWFGFRHWYFAFICRAEVLLWGALLALWSEHKKKLPLDRHKSADQLIASTGIGAAIALGSLLYTIRPILGREIRESVLFAAFGPLLIGLIVVALINRFVQARPTGTPLSRFLSSSVLVYIGERSYMIYLVHMPAYFVVDHLLNSLAPSNAERWVVSLLSSALSILLAAMSWRFFEYPILQKKETWTSSFMSRLHPAAEVVSS